VNGTVSRVDDNRYQRLAITNMWVFRLKNLKDYFPARLIGEREQMLRTVSKKAKSGLERLIQRIKIKIDHLKELQALGGKVLEMDSLELEFNW